MSNEIMKKLEEHDKHFERMNKKFAEHDKHFERMNKKFAEHDKHFEDMLEAINGFASHVEDRFNKIDQRFEKNDQRFDKIDQHFEKIDNDLRVIKSTMVTKGYLDEKLSDLRGDLSVLIRKEDTKVKELVNILVKKKILSEKEQEKLFKMEPFAQTSV